MNATTYYQYLLGQKALTAKAFDKYPTLSNRQAELKAGQLLGQQVKRMRIAGIPAATRI